MTITVRKGTEEDITVIMTIVKAVVPLMQAAGNFQWDEVYPTEPAFRKDIGAGECYVAVQQETNEVVGVTALTEDQSFEYADCGWDLSIPSIVPHRMAVSPDCRRQGVAAAMYAKGDELARERGYDRVRVDTNKVNGPMNATILKAGYKYAGEINLSSKPKDMRFNCYEKLLE